MRRRRFLKRFTLLAASPLAPNLLEIPRNPDQEREHPERRILVFVEMAGGCDGLNTVIPYTSDAYYSNRPNLAIQPRKVIPLNDSIALHPSMAGVKELFDDGCVAVVQGTGYPNPSRSHFRARDIWHTAAPAEVIKEGWMARYLELSCRKSSIQGMSVGPSLARALSSERGLIASNCCCDLGLQGEGVRNEAGQFTVSLRSNDKSWEVPEALRTRLGLQATEERTVHYPETVFGHRLRFIARMIASDLGVPVFHLSLGGFDLHRAQVCGEDSSKGRHAELLATFSSGIAAFQKDLKLKGVERQVLVVSFTEFGRRLDENSDLGTHHGTASPMFLIGRSVRPGIFGSHPSLDKHELDEDGDLRYTVDFRCVFAALLRNWLDVDPKQIAGISVPPLEVV